MLAYIIFVIIHFFFLQLKLTIGGTALVGVPTHLTFYKYTKLCFQPPNLSMKNVTSQLKPPLVMGWFS